MQKFFSAFPTGAPGLGLLLLRAFVALTLITADLKMSSWVIAGFFIAGGACLLIGFLTPVAAVSIALGAVALVIFFGSNYAIAVVFILGAAIALLGPGAFSVDARLFGRREIRIP